MKTSWTEEQRQAINLEGNNIIVSAGAGSGKTAVLSERVLRKAHDGIHVDRLLILTFTNAAAKEMKDRIRSKLKKENLDEEVRLIDNSYITTFDSFSLSLVKKYHTYLNISSNIGITDNSILNIEKRKILDDIFDEYYRKPSDSFSKLINDYCYKSDEDLKNLIIKLNDKLDLKYDKDNYLDSYLNEFYSDERIDNDINLYIKKIKNIIAGIKENIHELSLSVDGSYVEKLEDELSNLFNSDTYIDIKESISVKLPPLPRNSEEIAKNIKKNITKQINEIKDLVLYENEDEIKREILSTKSNVSVIIDIIKKLDLLFKKEKLKNNMFSFSDISLFAIKLVEDYKEIREELKEKFQEIMIDEYQDTNDLQEYFISLISNNNVYMVGDIKQSIYRFRNANPYIFKNKYDLYNNTDQGIKIDLLKNFRSRSEVLDNINLLFDNLMTDSYGGADYKVSHRMIFGNKTYVNEGKTSQDYNLKILEYKRDNLSSNLEKEIFIIANDIKKKIDSKYQIFDMKNLSKRDIEYNDFVILLDRATDFEVYKKVFEYFQIPLTLYKDEDLKSDIDILVIRNLLKLIRCIDKENYKEEFKYSFVSICRSFLFRKSDDEIFSLFINNSFKESDLYLKLIEAYNYYYELSPKDFFYKLCEIFNYEDKLLTTSNIDISRKRLEYFYNLIGSFENAGKDIEDFIEYLDTVFDSSDKVSFSTNTNSSNSVKIMTIHKSKGLEFPICYFAGFNKEFNFRELNDNILYSNKFGIITPYFNEYIKPTIYKTLLKIDNRKEEISEKIRLLYVALTRSKEHMIMVIPEVEEELNINEYNMSHIKSFYDMVKLIYSSLSKYSESIDIEVTKDYLINKNNNDIKFIDKDIEVEENSFDFEEEEYDKFSKGGKKLITKEEQEKMDFGTKVHEVLEFIDFNNPDYSNLDKYFRKKIESFINSDIIKNNLDSKFYKEYEFLYEKDSKKMHGIIDLMIENDKEIYIIDYKLKNTNDKEYNKQLMGYKEAIEKRTNKPIKIYLYSIIDEMFNEI